MHVTTKEVDANGSHILTSVIEADGACELASEKAELSASVVSVVRTAGGGIELKVAVSVVEPAPEVPKVEAPVASDKDVALCYLMGKGLKEDEAAGAVEKFGVAKVLEKRQQELDGELSALVSETAPEK